MVARPSGGNSQVDEPEINAYWFIALQHSQFRRVHGSRLMTSNGSASITVQMRVPVRDLVEEHPPDLRQ